MAGKGPRVVLFHWNAAEARERIERLAAGGFDAAWHDPTTGGAGYTALAGRPADAYLIDLARLPSHGRAIAAYLRQRKSTRHTPIVFVGGAPEKAAAARKLLPDAVFATWRGIGGALRRAIASGARAPIVPVSLSGYSGTPLPKKLGVRPETTLCVLDGPEGFERTLRALPAGATVRTDVRKPAERVLLFVRSSAQLARGFARARKGLAAGGSIWIAWPKQGSGLAGGLTADAVRAFGLGRGFVDYKVCAIDATWSGLCFAARK